MRASRTLRVAVLGSGNWGSTVAALVARNAARQAASRAGFARGVRMYVHPETYQGAPLAAVINARRENPRYLPGIRLPANLRADSDLETVLAGATHLIVVPPHEFVGALCRMAARVLGEASRGLWMLSLAKGLARRAGRGGRPRLWRMSEIAGEALGVPRERRAALSGPNVARQVALGEPTEASLACPSPAARRVWTMLFAGPAFRIEASADLVGVELGGALKNIVALGAGLADGLAWGSNTKATVIRRGLAEMIAFGRLPGLGARADAATWLGPAGIGDLMTTCSGGRNRRYGEALGQAWRAGRPPPPPEVFEAEALEGQKLQGTSTARDVAVFLRARGRQRAFPLFMAVEAIACRGRDPRRALVRALRAQSGPGPAA